jgi:GT2 family glycosyltransferase
MPVPEAPSLSIVIVCFGKREVTERCLATLDAAFGERLGGDVELVLVDNGSPDDTPELLSFWSDRATVILGEQNLNYAGGNNVGARAATGRVLVLLNNDTEVFPGVLDELAAQALEPGVAIAGCRLLYPNGTVQHGGSAWWRAPDGMIRPFHLFRHEAGDLPAACATFDCDFVTAACIAIRRDLFHELGGFDESYVNGWEDVDLCARARLAGQRVMYRGDLAIVHAEGLTGGRSRDESANERVFAGRYQHMLDEDSARLSSLLDGSGPNFGVGLHPGERPDGSAVSVEGEVTGLSGESAEARALLAALDAAGLEPATREWQPTLVTPRLSGEEWAPVQRAGSRSKRHGALTLQAPVGQLGLVDTGLGTVLRLAAAPAVDLSGVAAVWASSVALADELLAGGVDPERVEVLPPPIRELPLGAGGHGMLAILPTPDTVHCAALLSALAELPQRIRLLPTVRTERVVELASCLLPDAELLEPIGSELRFAALAAECDVVVCADPREPFERRALIAAAVGAAPVHLPGGTAAEVLRDQLAATGDWRADIERALKAAPKRAERAQAVRERCSEAATAARLAELLDRAERSTVSGHAPKR